MNAERAGSGMVGRGGRRPGAWALVAAGVVAGLAGGELLRGSPALAGPDKDGSDVLNAGAQRQRIIEALAQTNERLGRIEQKLNSGLSVKVTEMPAPPKEK